MYGVILSLIKTKTDYKKKSWISTLKPIYYVSVALYCAVLYCAVLYCSVLFCSVLYCSVL